MRIHWIWYAMLPGISHREKAQLLEYFRDPEEIWHTQVLPEIEGVTAQIRQALENKALSEAEKVLHRCMEKNISVLTFGDAAYPVKLKQIPDPPMVLYYRGTLPDWESVPVIGVVGTRKASAYGLNTAKRLSAQIAVCGGLVVSGGAFGVDTMAMQGALDAGKKVVGILGCGVDVVYPKSNRQLFAKIVENGCLLSEYVPGDQPLHWHFPERNRIISGMANGVLVVEAPEKSGALITARRALDQGRDVFVVPGNIDVASCAGSNALLNDGASAVFSGWDAVKEYEFLYPGKVKKSAANSEVTAEKLAQAKLFSEKEQPQPPENDKKTIDKGEKSPYSVLNSKVPALSADEQVIVAQLGTQAKNVDEVIAASGLAAGKALSILTMLALKGVVKNHPGKRVSLK